MLTTLTSANLLLKNVLIKHDYKRSCIDLLKIKSTYTVKKKPSVTQDQNTRVMENSTIQVERSEKSVNTRDWASLSTVYG
jgi:hypothetical protein